MKKTIALLTLSMLSTFLGGAALRAAEHEHAMAWTSVKQAVSVLHSTSGSQCHGIVRFTQEGDMVRSWPTSKGSHRARNTPFTSINTATARPPTA